MTGWVVATAATAALGAASVGAVWGPTGRPGTSWAQDSDHLWWVTEPEQAMRLKIGPGSQIGVSIRDVGDEDLKTNKTAAGVVVEDVEADSPAQKAGFRARDIIVEFDGERVRSTRQFTRLVQETPAGRPIQAAVLRDGQRVTLSVTPRDGGSFRYFENIKDLMAVAPKIPPPAVLKRDGTRLELLSGSGRLGITVDDLSTQLADYFGTKDGVLVTSVIDNSAAAKAGLKAGDVITSLDGATIASAADLRRRAQRVEAGDEFTLGVVRDRKSVTLKGKIESPTPRRPTARAIV